jgi:hypothetical protein
MKTVKSLAIIGSFVAAALTGGVVAADVIADPFRISPVECGITDQDSGVTECQVLLAPAEPATAVLAECGVTDQASGITVCYVQIVDAPAPRFASAIPAAVQNGECGVTDKASGITDCRPVDAVRGGVRIAAPAPPPDAAYLRLVDRQLANVNEGA